MAQVEKVHVFWHDKKYKIHMFLAGRRSRTYRIASRPRPRSSVAADGRPPATTTGDSNGGSDTRTRHQDRRRQAEGGPRRARRGRARRRPLESALATGRDMLWSPTIRAALLAGTPWLDIFCPGCGTGHRSPHPRPAPLASVGTLVLGLRCSWFPGSAPMPKPTGGCMHSRRPLE
jgi:hypothetical protein